MKVGLDDFFAAGRTVADLLRLASDELRPIPAPEESTDDEQDFFVKNGSTYWMKDSVQGPVPILLSNFSAEIVEEIVEDDGAETKRLYLMRVVVRGQTQEISVLAERFCLMNWPADQLGPGAIVTAGFGSKDRLREAIQVLSPKQIPKRLVYRHLGWIDRDEKAIYLHAAGAIGAEGAVPGIDVRLDSPLDRYVLPHPPTGDALRDAVRESLALVGGLASDKVMFPLFSFLWTTVLQPLPESLHITGKTGERKTELLALAQRHQGASMDAANLPLAWSSTGNMIEVVAFLAKDSLLGLDDYCPTGSATDVQRQNREADRVFRGRGNSSGRGRLRSDGTPRPVKPFRAGICSTGEDVPHGHSMRARLIVLRVEEGEVNLDALSKRQAAGNLYPMAMSGFIQWLARNRARLLQWFSAEVSRVRAQLLPNTAHGRTATAGAKLILGLNVFLQFAKEVGAIDEPQRQNLDHRAKQAILAVLAEQAEHQAASDPAPQFIQLIAAALTAGDAHLADRPTGGVPSSSDLARAAGWQRTELGDIFGSGGDWRGRGPQIGWIDADNEAVYLNPTPAYRAAQKQGDASPSRIGLGERALWDRLHEAGMLVSADPGRHTKKIRIAGRLHNVIHLRLSLVFGEAGTSGTGPDDRPGEDRGRDLFPISVPDLAVGLAGSGTDIGNAIASMGASVPTADAVPVVPDPPQGDRQPSPTADVISSETAPSPAPHSTNASLVGPCRQCRSERFWHKRDGGPRVCGVCHPPIIPLDEVVWIETESTHEEGEAHG